ncbi:porin [Klebsiella pneumoniae]|uniref:porin n=1 Tax=Klebsiella pneumoniae TaxID=573 RepID=UPI001EEE272E|nr:porin [Klebsiella pneumoniae]EKV6600972.1 porin [Klebsiella pneumoniae]EKW8875331.1 porin [Klebsiella pneumoniae]MDX8297814.1 porin [Klebsiella pneumoniae]
MKVKVLSLLVPALLVAGAANAAEIYNKDGNKLDLYGKIDGLHYFSDDKSVDGDQNSKLALGRGDNAETYTGGLKYDANNIYLATQYTQTYNATRAGSLGFANKAQNFEVVAQYQFDFGLRPSVAYLQSKGKDLEGYGDQDILKYVDVGATYYFNKNMSTYVDYKINLLDDNSFTHNAGISTDDVVALGLVYQF